MNTHFDPSKLIFIICQPRSGSSMLQQMILSSGKVISLPEPWLLLPILFITKYPGIQSVYNSNFAHICFSDYLAGTPQGNEKYLTYLSEFICKIYGMNIISSDQYFLDKTPRYYHIIKEIISLFPDSRVIIIKRNPLSVFASILSYNFYGNYRTMLKSPDRLHDLITAPKKLFEADALNHKNVLTIKYEDIVSDPDSTIDQLNGFFNNIGLKQLYNIHESFKNSTSIDTKSVHKHNKPVNFYVDDWKTKIETSKKKKLLRGYLLHMGKDFWNNYGYDFNNMEEQLKKHKVKFSPCRNDFNNYVHKYFKLMS